MWSGAFLGSINSVFPLPFLELAHLDLGEFDQKYLFDLVIPWAPFPFFPTKFPPYFSMGVSILKELWVLLRSAMMSDSLAFTAPVLDWMALTLVSWIPIFFNSTSGSICPWRSGVVLAILMFGARGKDAIHCFANLSSTLLASHATLAGYVLCCWFFTVGWASRLLIYYINDVTGR